jgi:hypothetical protein
MGKFEDETPPLTENDQTNNNKKNWREDTKAMMSGATPAVKPSKPMP